MDWFKECKNIISEKNGWLDMDKVIRVIQSSLKKADISLTKESLDHQFVIKDFKVEFFTELHINPIDNTTKLRLPTQAKHLDDKFDSTQLSRISFSLGIVPVSLKE